MKENIMVKRCAAAFGPLVLAVSLLFGAPAQAAPPDNPTGVRLADKPLTGAAHPGGVKGNPATIGRQAKTQTQAQALTTTSCSPGPCFKYATEIDNSVTATGAQVTMTVHKPKLLGWDWHSLAEQSIADSGERQHRRGRLDGRPDHQRRQQPAPVRLLLGGRRRRPVQPQLHPAGRGDAAARHHADRRAPTSPSRSSTTTSPTAATRSTAPTAGG
jgi:hypothetical protein